MKCTLIVGRRHKSWRPGSKEEFTGRFDRSNLFFTSIKKAREAAGLADLESYRVMEVDSHNDFYFSNEKSILYSTPDVDEYLNKEKKRAERFDRKQNKAVELINALPDAFYFDDFGVPKFKVYIDRSKYEYAGSHSKRLKGSLGFRFKYNDDKCGRDYFSASAYLTRNGRFQMKKFKQDLYWDLGIPADDLPEDFDYREFFNKLQAAKKEVKAKIEECKSKAYELTK